MKPLYQSMIFTGALLALTSGAFAQSNTSPTGSSNTVTSGTANSNTTAPASTSTFESDTTGRNATILDERAGTAGTMDDRNDSYTGTSLDSDNAFDADTATDATSGSSAGSSSATLNTNETTSDETSSTETEVNVVTPTITRTEPTGFDSNEVRKVQSALKGHGYNINVDGVWGNETISTLRRFQLENDLTQTGKLDTPTRNRLNMKTSAITDDASASDATANR